MKSYRFIFLQQGTFNPLIVLFNKSFEAPSDSSVNNEENLADHVGEAIPRTISSNIATKMSELGFCVES